jgi:sugar/nucleoside kinase (ribokinase family)
MKSFKPLNASSVQISWRSVCLLKRRVKDVIWNQGEPLIPEIAMDTVDATGAGDAFAAALAVSEAKEPGFGEAG